MSKYNSVYFVSNYLQSSSGVNGGLVSGHQRPTHLCKRGGSGSTHCAWHHEDCNSDRSLHQLYMRNHGAKKLSLHYTCNRHVFMVNHQHQIRATTDFYKLSDSARYRYTWLMEMGRDTQKGGGLESREVSSQIRDGNVISTCSSHFPGVLIHQSCCTGNPQTERIWQREKHTCNIVYVNFTGYIPSHWML